MANTHLYNHTMVFAETHQARIHCVNLLFIICLINIIFMVFIARSSFFSYSWSGVGGGGSVCTLGYGDVDPRTL